MSMSYNRSGPRSVSFQIDPTTYAQIQQVAAAQGLSVRQFAKHAVGEKVSRDLTRKATGEAEGEPVNE